LGEAIAAADDTLVGYAFCTEYTNNKDGNGKEAELPGVRGVATRTFVTCEDERGA